MTEYTSERKLSPLLSCLDIDEMIEEIRRAGGEVYLVARFETDDTPSQACKRITELNRELRALGLPWLPAPVRRKEAAKVTTSTPTSSTQKTKGAK